MPEFLLLLEFSLGTFFSHDLVVLLSIPLEQRDKRLQKNVWEEC